MSNKSPVSYPTDNQNYQVVWSMTSEGWSSHLSQHPVTRSLPIFLAGDIWRQYKQTAEYEAEQHWAALGILYTWPERGPWQYPVPEVLDDYRFELVSGIATMGGLGLSDFILSASSWVRWNCGCRPSQLVLKGGMLALPQSAQIRYDYMLDTWSLVERLSDQYQTATYEELVTNFQMLDLDRLKASKIGQSGVNTACYIFLSSLLLLGNRREFDAQAKIIVNNVMRAPRLSARLMAAASLDCPKIEDIAILSGPSLY